MCRAEKRAEAEAPGNLPPRSPRFTAAAAAAAPVEHGGVAGGVQLGPSEVRARLRRAVERLLQDDAVVDALAAHLRSVGLLS
jgi:hypothetical protein